MLKLINICSGSELANLYEFIIKYFIIFSDIKTSINCNEFNFMI